MTPAQVEQAARERYNAVSDNNWSQAEVYNLIYAAMLEIAQETKCIERSYTATTVASTQSYALPTYTISVKRVTYDGQKLEPIDFREDDVLTLDNSSTTSTGNSRFYVVWNNTLYLRPIPSSALTLQVWSFNEPTPLTTTSTSLDVPTFTHMRLVDYVVSEMAAKDKDFQTARYYKDIWLSNKVEIKKWIQKRRRGDAFNSVRDEQLLSETYLGLI